MVGATVCRVESSQHAGFSEGELVLAYTGWQDYAVSDGVGITKIAPSVTHPSYALGVLGMPGFTAYMGLLDIGQPQAGGADKCRSAVEDLGFDACIDHHNPELARLLALACPQGIDIYFENVGGKVFEAVLPLLNTGARVPVCGLIAHYNATALPAGPDRTPVLMRTLLTKRIRMQGFIIFDDYAHRYPEFAEAMGQWLADGKIKFREDVVDGLGNTPNAFIGLLDGKNFGKLIVRVAHD